jgi:Ca-activated chloride channel family protein
MVIPPAEMTRLQRSPVEMVFVVDRSGSMNGQPIAQARAAVESGLKRLRAGDSFQIIDFAESAGQLGPAPLEATPENLRRGLAYAARLDAGGGTMMINGLRAALAFPHDPERLRVVSFLTDGFIGNEAEILKTLHDQLGATRVFGFGVGSAPNRYLLADMSRIGRGAVAYVGLQDPASEVMDLFFERISHPALADLSFDWGGTRVMDVFPARPPDLFVGRPVIVTGRYEGDWGGTIRVRGRAGGSEREIAIASDSAGARVAKGSLPAVWARMKIADLTDRALLDGTADAQTGIRRVALEYGLMSAYTAFVAVDSMTRTESPSGTTVAVPVPVPEGVRYETTVGSAPRAERRR